MITDPIQAEFTVHRVGGSDQYDPEQGWRGPWERCWTGTGPLADHAQLQLHGEHQSNAYMILKFWAFDVIERGWWGSTVTLMDGMNGRNIGRAPVPLRVFSEPFDVPMYTQVWDEWYGYFSIGVRALGAPLEAAETEQG